MVRQIITELGRTFSEYSLLPGYTPRGCIIPNINLGTNLADLELRIPFLSAAMTSVTGYEMALALGKEGGLGVLPARLPVEEQADIVRRVKGYEMGFVEEPLVIRSDAPVSKAVSRVEDSGHRKIPIVNRNNVLLGLFTQDHYWETRIGLDRLVTDAMIPFDESNDNIPYVKNPGITIEDAKAELQRRGSDYLVVLDEQNRLVKLAFKKDVDRIKIGAAVSTHEGWRERVQANAAAGVDMVFIDTSDAHSEYVKDVIEAYKKMDLGIPLCAGNVVTLEGALDLMRWGADAVKVGMSSGSICITQRQKAVGRAPMTALIQAGLAQSCYIGERGRYVPIIMDGGVANSADMIIALTIADALMMGNYFNRFNEAAAEKLDEDRKPTTDATKMRFVASWGEGSRRAMNLARYAQTQQTFFEEGVEDRVAYAGRLKPNVRKDLMKIRAALSNVGAMNLVEFRENAVIEVNSVTSDNVTRQPHHLGEGK